MTALPEQPSLADMIGATLGITANTLSLAQRQFARYAEQHRAKGTDDGLMKARVNEAFAALMAVNEAILTNPVEAGRGTGGALAELGRTLLAVAPHIDDVDLSDSIRATAFEMGAEA